MILDSIKRKEIIQKKDLTKGEWCANMCKLSARTEEKDQIEKKFEKT